MVKKISKRELELIEEKKKDCLCAVHRMKCLGTTANEENKKKIYYCEQHDKIVTRSYT